MVSIFLVFLAAALDPAAVNDVSSGAIIDAKAKGAAVVRAQILLDRAHFSPGQIDGTYGHNLQVAIAAYRAAHGLPAGETVDAEMWKQLNADTAPALTEYTISPEDVAGPFAKTPADMIAKSKLKQLWYESAADALGEKFHCAPQLLLDLNEGKPLEEAGTTIFAPNTITAAPAGTVAQVVVHGESRTVEALGADGKVIAFYPATVGSEHDPLPVGTWKIVGVQRDPVFHYNSSLFWDAKGDHAEANIAPGPRNPVGVVWMALSKEHYGIHGTPEPRNVGHTASHGCIRLTNWSASELAGLVKAGTPAILEEQ